MARILTVGIATLDIINTVDGFPAEDAEVRAMTQVMNRGGNASNTAVVLSQLGNACAWAGSLADDANSEVIRADLKSYGVDMSAIISLAEGRTPTSYVTLNQHNGSRTIVHYRDLPEFSVEQFRVIDLREYDWLHFEGRNVVETRAMLDHAKQCAPELPISVEIEKPRPAIETLCAGVDLLLYSRGYAQHCISQHGDMQQRATQKNASTTENPEAFLYAQYRAFPMSEHTCTWGDDGAWGMDRRGELFHSPAVSVPRVVDTLAAGDTFNAGMIHSKLGGLSLQGSLVEACQLAGEKCAQQGLQGLR